MNIALILVAIVMLAAVAFAAGYVSRRPDRREHTIEELAGLAECNGIELLRMARECRQLARACDDPSAAGRLQRWASTAEQGAQAQLACINAVLLRVDSPEGLRNILDAENTARARGSVSA